MDNELDGLFSFCGGVRGERERGKVDNCKKAKTGRPVCILRLIRSDNPKDN